ncbi:MAG: PEP-CTERM sorting domain-containing protein [Crocosphaera sp.]|nr:PEP-CTERM sorting domain-containing protein [Crocosphaera sp.]
MLKLKQIIPGMLTSLSFAVVSSVEAATVVNTDSSGNVVSISDLEICISGAEICAKTQEELEENEIKIIDSYDVAFPPGLFNEIFGDPTQPDFMGSCDDGLCFWGNQTQANLAITSINDAINMLDPTPPLVTGELVLPPLPPITQTNNFYRVPLSFDDADNSITSRQGTNNDADPDNPWILDEIVTNSIDTIQFYADFQFIAREIIRPIPPDTPNVPEPSSLMGILFTFGSVLMVSKKKN